MDDHQFKEENESVGELSKVCSQIVLTFLYLAHIGKPDFLWSVNKFARSITKCSKACDKRLNRLISYIHHTCEYKQYCHVGNTAKQCRLGLFQDSDFAGDLDSQRQHLEEFCAFSKVTRLCQSVGCARNWLQFHTALQAEIICLDAGLRMDVVPALTLWDLVIEVFHSVPNQTDGPKREPRGTPSAVDAIPIKRTNVIPTNIDYIQSNGTHSGSSAMLYVFEDNEAVNKMMIIGRSPTMRHVSRTHRVALDWVFDRINVDSKIQIRFIDTEHPIADMLTKGNFTRDGWGQSSSFVQHQPFQLHLLH